MISTKTLYSPVLKTEQIDDAHKFQSLPQPSGSYPYRLSVPGNKEKMTFHMVGDTGGLTELCFQQQVITQMTAQCLNATKADQPSFLYHLGDIVYHYGEAEQYETQFLSPFESYPKPIYAIAGNHDSDINPDSDTHYDSLEAFYTTFCNTCPKTIYFGQNTQRKSQIQPNVYWTMEAPLATIIGLYTNVPKYGCIKKDQRSWFIKELQNAAKQNAEKAIIVCLHHAPYSADYNHGSSLNMIEFLESAFEEAGVKPDVVFSGHVHNYQRFSKQYSDGKTIPFIVAGAGGFEELHTLADPLDPAYITQSPNLDDILLESYCDNQHGFLKIVIEKSPFSFTIKGAYYTVSQQKLIAETQEPALFDSFTIDLTGR
ncbi:MAG: metallophosphoesterase [Candidatus Pedobacter colombiensis]|uniref:Metallophosphoesterase n=1 Tax=Candidatus Pedobacter colombiensis TaxID=3121371 RepID=A0AAJ5W583_9SPHI|nr:metallophosphoesterase [Pedobacter sp.]WEK18773.1 MAG: metallophosphoesterase [Pedobacter sp.]